MASRTIRLPIVGQASEPADVDTSLLARLLHEQSELSAVERFSQRHGDAEAPLLEPRYRALMPATPPGPGQQYAFEVDLDRCSGCKACVSACHQMNGLDDGETWRSVGTLHGGTESAPVHKTVTTACHHCLEPACMKGCPVKAYEKDPDTGIVRHLDDQCIGCQYCLFTCPYEVPQLNEAKGIVRKCDMCSDRLAEGEAPACVQACPTDAIAIRLVDTEAVAREAETEVFLPAAPSPAITLPTTRYVSSDPLPPGTRPADFHAARPAHRHLPLVVMLVLTQLSVGAFAMEQLLPALLDSATLAVVRPWHGAVALAIGLFALGASVAHLGRPRFAFRAVLGLRTSWLSREIVAFGLFAGLAAAHALGQLAGLTLPSWSGALVVGAGVVGVVCSVKLYEVTGRRWWSASRTAFRFGATSVVLGAASSIAVSVVLLAGAGSGALESAWPMVRRGALALAGASALQLVGEAAVLARLRNGRAGELERSARLLVGPLRSVTFCRFLAGFVGGVVLPLVLLQGGDPSRPGIAAGGALAALLFCLLGALLERVTFFAAASAPRMPGSLA